MLDPITLSSLLASRLCHDLINPVGALGAGLEIMETEQDPEMQAEAMKLVNNSAQKAVALLQFSRMAFGAGGAYGDTLDLEEVRGLVGGIYEHVRAALIWEIPPGHLEKSAVRILMNLALLISDCVPRAGSTVRISKDETGIILLAEGPKARLKEPLIAALSGVEEGLEPKLTPAFMCHMIASDAGHQLQWAELDEEHVRIRLNLAE